MLIMRVIEPNPRPLSWYTVKTAWSGTKRSDDGINESKKLSCKRGSMNRLRLLTAFLYGPLKRLCQLSVGYFLWTGVFTALRAVRQPGALWQLRLRQEAGFGARGANYQQVLLQVYWALRGTKRASLLMDSIKAASKKRSAGHKWSKIKKLIAS